MRLGAEIEYLAAEREIDGHQQITAIVDALSARRSVRPGQFARIRSMKFIGLLARSGHAASERGGRRAEGCERARRAAFRVPTEPKNLRPHGARLVRFFPSRAGGSGG